MILYKIYSSNLKNLEIGEGFFKDWPNPPSKENHRKILEELYDFYMVDLCCDESLQSFYKKLGMIKSQGMICRNYKYQCSTNL
ncbi:hypothetical protein [Clostridium sp. FP1]|uniref:hypothetical protein n=1 Tax=Clostridium sp. FP1 TaxID=2724076 RepID=UPI0013E90F4E|nr:hypothetical protein [Clostridium sp. FP1]MBZ9637554.1 hypothetical protein [Clostridium sp. FP1]